MKNYDNLDLLKFILCFMIVAIHTQLFPMILYPWLRLAVPLFFITSSFLIFKKINMEVNREKEIIKKYFNRQLKFYFFWFVLLLPLTIYIRLEWFENGLAVGLIKFVSNLLFSSTFIASWFIVANFEGIVIVSIFHKKRKKILYLLSLFFYILCCLLSSYIMFLNKNIFIQKMIVNYERFLPSFIFSFPVAIVYIIIGKKFSDKEEDIIVSLKDYLFLIISCILLFIEWRICYSFTGTYNNDCYFMLLPCSYFIFKIVLSKKMYIKNSKSFRTFSVICFPLHGSLQYLITFLLKHFINNSNLIGLLSFIITLLCCYIIYLTILRLEKNKLFHFLKYSH